MATGIVEMKSKASRELAQVALLQEHCPYLAGRTLVSLDPPEPDVGAGMGASTIGIEVTAIHGNPPLNMTMAEQDKVLRIASELWRERGLPAILVAVQWRPTRLAQRFGRDLPLQLVNIVADRLRPATETIQIDDSTLSTTLGSGSAVEHISATRSSDERDNCWGSGRRWQASSPNPDFFQRAIDRKKNKPAAYTGQYDERWLLLVHDTTNPAAGFDVSAAIDRASFTSTFDRVVLMSTAPFRLRYLRIQNV